MFRLMQNSCQTNVIKWRRDFDPELVSLSENWGREATPRKAPVPAARFGPVYKHTTTMLQLSLNTVFALQVNGERSKFWVKS